MKKVWKWILVVLLVLLAVAAAGYAFLSNQSANHGQMVKVKAVVKPSSDGKKGTVTIVFTPRGEFSLNDEGYPTKVKVTAPKGIILTPVHPVIVNSPAETEPMTYRISIVSNKAEFAYEIKDRRFAPAEVKLSVRYGCYEDGVGTGILEDHLEVQIPVE